MPELRLPRRLETVSAVCDRAEALVVGAGWPPADVTRVTLALGEAVGNAVEHGGDGEGAIVRVSMALDGPTLLVCVDDGGPGPSPDHVAEASLPDETLATSGRGLYILQHVADDVRVDPDGGLCVTIRSRG